MKQKSMFFWNSFAFSMIQQRWQFDLWYLCLFITQLVPLEDLVHVLKVCLVKAMVFPVVMYRCESWTVKKVESRRIDAFEQWCWRRLESPLDCREIQPVHPKGNQSWIFIGRTEWCWSWSSNTLANWCEELTHLKRPWFWERLRAGGEGDDRRWDGWMASPTQWTGVWVNSGSWWWTGRPGMLQFMGLQKVRHNWATELNWTENEEV